VPRCSRLDETSWWNWPERKSECLFTRSEMFGSCQWFPVSGDWPSPTEISEHCFRFQHRLMI
jgi:hypothetical protein